MRFEMRWSRHDRGDQTVDRADADIAAMAIATQNLIEFIIGVYRLAHAATLAASASRAAFQFQAKSSCSWLFFVRPETIRSKTSISQASGSSPLSLQVLRSDDRIAQVSPPPTSPQKRLFFFPIAIGRIVRSTVFVSGSNRPSSRNKVRPAQ